MSAIPIRFEVPSLPGGWTGTPDQLLQWMVENAKFFIDGDSISGSVGGAAPPDTEDAGLSFGENSIESFRTGKYRPITDVPIGAVLAWASASATPPANYLLCQGQSVLRTDYADLFAVIGVDHGSVDSTHFNLPDTRARSVVGAGEGVYDKQADIGTGKTKNYTVGQHIGASWPVKTNVYSGAPTTKMTNITGTSLNPAAANYSDTTNPSVVLQHIIRYR